MLTQAIRRKRKASAVSNVMKTGNELVTCSTSDFVTAAAKKMEEHDVGAVLVTRNGKLKGIVTDRDLVLHVLAEGQDPNETKLEDVMRTDLVVGKPEWDINEAARIMAEKRVRRLPIERNGKLAGLLSLSDLAPIAQRELNHVLELEGYPAHP